MSLTEFSEEERAAIAQRRTALRFLFFPLQIVAMWFIAYPWPVDHWAVRVFWILVTSYFMFCWTSCFHETAHQTLFRSQRLSVMLGRVLGWLMFVPYTAYREAHIRHHAYMNKPNDWELWPYADPKASKRFRRAFVWLDVFAGAVAAPFVYGRIYFHPDSPLKPEQRRAVRWEYAGMICFWVAIFALATYYQVLWALVLVYFVPQALAGVYQNGRKLTEHLGMASYDPLEGTRTVVGANPITRISTFLNFDIFVHGPHHRHPRVSHDQLEQLTLQYMADARAQGMRVYPTYASAVREMLPWMLKNPGVGVNVGAAAPAGTREVDDFVADVNKEVLESE